MRLRRLESCRNFTVHYWIRPECIDHPMRRIDRTQTVVEASSEWRPAFWGRRRAKYRDSHSATDHNNRSYRSDQIRRSHESGYEIPEVIFFTAVTSEQIRYAVSCHLFERYNTVNTIQYTQLPTCNKASNWNNTTCRQYFSLFKVRVIVSAIRSLSTRN